MGSAVEGDVTLEGILLGRWAGHYVLTRCQVLESEESSLSVGDVEVPAERVLFVQVLGRGR